MQLLPGFCGLQIKCNNSEENSQAQGAAAASEDEQEGHSHLARVASVVAVRAGQFFSTHLKYTIYPVMRAFRVCQEAVQFHF